MTEKIERDTLEKSLYWLAKSLDRKYREPGGKYDPEVGTLFIEESERGGTFAIAAYSNEQGGINFPFGLSYKTAEDLHSAIWLALRVVDDFRAEEKYEKAKAKHESKT